MDMRTFTGEPLDMSYSYGPWTDDEDGEYVKKSTDTTNETGTMTTTNWPHNATNKVELNTDQREVIRTAMQNPGIETIAEINRLCDYENDHAEGYAHNVLDDHWPERKSNDFNPDMVGNGVTYESEHEERDSETSAEETEEDGELLMLDGIGTTSEDENNDASEWPDNATPRHKLNQSQIDVIEAAVRNPDVTSTPELTRLAGLDDDYNNAYAHDVLSSHWRERLSTTTTSDETPTDEESVESIGVTPPDDFDAFPDELGSKDEYNEAQITVVQTVMLNPDIDTATDIMRASGLVGEYDLTYASTFFYENWEEWQDYNPVDDGVDLSTYRSDDVTVESNSVSDETDAETQDDGNENDEEDVGVDGHDVFSGNADTVNTVETDNDERSPSRYWVVGLIVGVLYVVYRAINSGD